MMMLPWNRICALLLCGLALAPFLAHRPAPPAFETGVSVAEAMGGEAEDGWARVERPRPFVFPRDHGSHPDHQVEWWYLTGHLEAASGERFGYQFTLFRNGQRPHLQERPSRWASNQLWMGHLALVAPERNAHRSFERFQREALGLAGASVKPYRVWLDSWELSSESEGEHPFPLRLRAEREGFGLDLVLRPAKPIVLQGDRGYSRKGAEAGNASHYYSFTRLEAEGDLSFERQSLAVRGSSWMDHEWSTSALSKGIAGWDWFSIQLDDGRELMLYQLRTDAGGAAPSSAGTWVARDGTSRKLGVAEFSIAPLARWTSPRSGGTYPSRWRLSVPTLDLELTVVPRLADQELETSVRYWEGACTVEGRIGEATARGRAYVELVGYAAAGR